MTPQLLDCFPVDKNMIIGTTTFKLLSCWQAHNALTPQLLNCFLVDRHDASTWQLLNCFLVDKHTIHWHAWSCSHQPMQRMILRHDLYLHHTRGDTRSLSIYLIPFWSKQLSMWYHSFLWSKLNPQESLPENFSFYTLEHYVPSLRKYILQWY